MKEPNRAVSISESPNKSLGSISLLAFLVEESTPEVYRDPINAMHGSEPLRSKQPLDDIYTIKSADGDLLEIKKSGREFNISKSFDISSVRLIGAALIAATYSTIPDIDIRGGQHAAYGRKHPSIPLTNAFTFPSIEEVASKANTPITPEHIATIIDSVSTSYPNNPVPSQQIEAIFHFWVGIDPEFELIREIKTYISRNIASQILDFDVITEAIDSGELTTRADSIENISPRLGSLESIDAIKSPELLDKFLKKCCGFGMNSSLCEKTRLNFTPETNYSNLIPSGLANPLIESLLARLFMLTPDDCKNNSELTWYSRSESDLYNLYAQKAPSEERNLRSFAKESPSISFGNYDWMFGGDPSEDDQIDAIVSSLPDRIPIPPALIIAAASNARGSLGASFAEISTVASMANGSATWIDDNDIIDTIRVVYDTPGKIARQRYCEFNDEAEYSTDKYLANRLPVDPELAKNLITVPEITTEEADKQIDSVTPGIIKNSLRVGPGYIRVSLSDPAELVGKYILRPA